MNTILHTIDKPEKIKIHMTCPFCGKDLFPGKRLLLEDLRNRFQLEGVENSMIVNTTDLMINRTPDNLEENNFTFSSECCGLKIIYDVRLGNKIRNVKNIQVLTDNKEEQKKLR
jgi:hypothetical protein